MCPKQAHRRHVRIVGVEADRKGEWAITKQTSGLIKDDSIYMSSTQEVISKQLLDVVPAANDDHVEQQGAQAQSVDVTDTASGWDAYEVWRRFIKDARDRRNLQGASAK